MVAVVHCARHAWGESGTPSPDLTLPPATVAEAQPDSDAEATWFFSASAFGYIVPDGRDYVQPTLTADRDWLHLEARYNYEALETGSLWVGYNFAGGKTLTWEFTPILGGVFGHTSGIAPGFEGTLGWWKLELYSEGEYVFDTDRSSDSFLYNWTELALSPVDWFRLGIAAQRTQAYKADRDVERGLLVGFSYAPVDLATYVFDLDTNRPTVIVALGLEF